MKRIDILIAIILTIIICLMFTAVWLGN